MVMSSNNNTESSSAVNAVAERALNRLVAQFPVCLASDEFHFFPQMASQEPDWSQWDDFSPDAVIELVQKIALRDGFGDTLADGSLSAAKKIGCGAEKYAFTMKLKRKRTDKSRGWGAV